MPLPAAAGPGRRGAGRGQRGVRLLADGVVHEPARPPRAARGLPVLVPDPLRPRPRPVAQDAGPAGRAGPARRPVRHVRLRLVPARGWSPTALGVDLRRRSAGRAAGTEPAAPRRPRTSGSTRSDDVAGGGSVRASAALGAGRAAVPPALADPGQLGTGKRSALPQRGLLTRSR